MPIRLANIEKSVIPDERNTGRGTTWYDSIYGG